MNKAIIFCAPSGSGKTTIVKYLLSKFDELIFSVSACTRKQRAKEINGKDYYFLSLEEFENKISEESFLEFEEVYDGNYYGTLKSEIERIWELNKIVIFDVDVQGGLNLKNYFGDKCLSIFVKPPSIQELEIRLRDRSTETEETIKTRIEKATYEMEYENKFDIVLVNNLLESAFSKAEKLVSDFINI